MKVSVGFVLGVTTALLVMGFLHVRGAEVASMVAHLIASSCQFLN